jgi:hypothetical protein
MVFSFLILFPSPLWGGVIIDPKASESRMIGSALNHIGESIFLLAG